MIARDETITWLTHDDGTPATTQEICAAIVDAKAKGYDVLPPCDNINEKGHCKGHPIGLPEIKVSGAAQIEYGHKLTRFDVLHEEDFEEVL
jgi:hypothetical protein